MNTVLWQESSRKCYLKWLSSDSSSRVKWCTLTHSHKRSQVMEIPRTRFSYKTHTPKTNGFSSKIQKNIWLKSNSFPEEKKDYGENFVNNLLYERRQKQDSQRNLGKTFCRNQLWIYVTRHSRAKYHNMTGISYTSLPDARDIDARGTT